MASLLGHARQWHHAMRRQKKTETDMRRREGTKILTRLLNHVRIGLGALALMLVAASVQVPAVAETVLAEVAYAGEMASSEVADTLRMIDTEFALSEPLYRGTDRGVAILILALVFSGIVAFNLWFFRQVRLVYAPSFQGSGGASNCR
jgi:hypothetical protein